MKKTISILTAICITGSVVGTVNVSAAGKYLAITDKYSGTAPAEYAGEISGNDFTFKQGNETADILDSIKSDSSWQNAVKSSDVIYISVGYSDIIEPVLKAVGENQYKDLADAANKFDNLKATATYETLKDNVENIADNAYDIASETSKLNPNAKIVVENVYNPLDFDGVENYGKVYTLINTQISGLTKEINAMIDESEKDNKNIKIADTASLFKGKSDILTNVTDLSADANVAGNILRADEILTATGMKTGKSDKISDEFEKLPLYTIAKLRNEKINGNIDKYLNSAATREIGDTNDDGKTDSSDAAVILRDYAGVLLGESSKLGGYYADLNADGKVDSADAAEILVYYANNLIGVSSNINSYIIEKS